MKTIILTLLLLLAPAISWAQKNSDERQLLEYKLKFLAQEMELKSDQQNTFVTLYSRMSGEKRKAYEAAIDLEHRVKRNENATAEDYAKATEAMTAAKVKEGQIDQKYEKEFKKFLTPKQLYLMKQAEDKFRQSLEKAHKKHRGRR